MGHIKGIPADIGKYDINCSLCKVSAATKLPRGGFCDTTEIRKDSAFNMDWLIFNLRSRIEIPDVTWIAILIYSTRESYQ